MLVCTSCSCSFLVDDADNVLISVDQVFLVTQFDLSSAIARDDHCVAHLHAHGDHLTLGVPSSHANGQHFGLIDLLLGRVGQQNSTSRFGLCLQLLHQNAIRQGHESLEGLSHEQDTGREVTKMASGWSGATIVGVGEC